MALYDINVQENWNKDALVLITRPAHQAHALHGLFESVGLSANCMPMMAIERFAQRELSEDSFALVEHIQRQSSSNCAAGEAPVARAPEYDRVIFVSANAVNAAAELVKGEGFFNRVPCIAMGKASAEAIQYQGWRLDPACELTGASWASSSEALLALDWAQQVEGQRLLICRGQGGLTLLGNTLQDRGATVDFLELYRRVPCRYDYAEHLRLCQWLAAPTAETKFVVLGSVQTAEFFLDQLDSAVRGVTAAGDDPFTSEEGAEIRVALVVPSRRAAQAVERLLQSHGAATLFTTSVLVAENASDMAMLGAVRSAR